MSGGWNPGGTGAGVAAHAEVVLDPPLGGQAIVVPAHRVEDLPAAHPLEARHGVGVRIGEDVADVQRTADGRRRRIDRVDAVARRAPVKAVRPVALPTLAPRCSSPSSVGLSGTRRSGGASLS